MAFLKTLDNGYAFYLRGQFHIYYKMGLKHMQPLWEGGLGRAMRCHFFIIEAKILYEHIRNDQHIKGLETVGVKQKISQYADNITLFIAPD